MASVLKVLKELLHSATETNLPSSVCLQFFSQLCHWINATLWNMLTSKPELCLSSLNLLCLQLKVHVVMGSK